jgi:hypothetical protein
MADTNFQAAQNDGPATQADAPNSSPAAPKATNALPRIPAPHKGFQYNVCKNPKCPQFGLHPELSTKRGVLGPYAVTSGGKGYPLLKCNVCGETPPMKSNVGITEEIERLSAYLHPEPIHCPNDAKDPATGEHICRNHAEKIPVGTPKAYRAYGTNAHGSKRVRCTCGKVFIVARKNTVGQHNTRLNRGVFSKLVNKVPLSRIVKMQVISWEVLYHRIDFIHRQCLAFAAHRERKLKTLPIKRLYLAVDSQDYFVNWTERKDKKNVVLKAITASDNKTGYVFCNALNFDDAADREQVERDAMLIGDAHQFPPRRRYARYWLAADYQASVAKTAKTRRLSGAATLDGEISATYRRAEDREDVETFDEKPEESALPSNGLQVHSEYTMIAMFHHLREMIGNCDAWRFFLDQESGIRAACFSAFADRIKERTCEAFYVRIEKELVQDFKRERVEAAKKRFRKAQKLNPSLSKAEVELLLLKEEIANKRKLGSFNDAWITIPLPSMAEPEKAVCWLTAHDDFRDEGGNPDENHVAWLINKSSLHSVDTFFLKMRRSVCMCERSLHSSANAGRTWLPYQAYNPSVLKKLIEIYRVHHNFVDLPMKGKKADKTTPAMRLGLADAPLDFQDILYFEG